MANYFSQCVVSPMLPLAQLSPADLLILEGVFDSEVEGDELYLFSEDGRRSSITLEVAEIRAALAGSAPGVAAELLAKALTEAGDAAGTDPGAWIDVEVEDAWIAILQALIAREETLSFVAVETAHTCSKMRPDGFGGGAIVITADTLDMMSTSAFIDETLAARLDAAADGARPI